MARKIYGTEKREIMNFGYIKNEEIRDLYRSAGGPIVGIVDSVRLR